jgi:hypothetical protein
MWHHAVSATVGVPLPFDLIVVLTGVENSSFGRSMCTEISVYLGACPCDVPLSHSSGDLASRRPLAVLVCPRCFFLF